MAYSTASARALDSEVGLARFRGLARNRKLARTLEIRDSIFIEHAGHGGIQRLETDTPVLTVVLHATHLGWCVDGWVDHKSVASGRGDVEHEDARLVGFAVEELQTLKERARECNRAVAGVHQNEAVAALPMRHESPRESPERLGDSAESTAKVGEKIGKHNAKIVELSERRWLSLYSCVANGTTRSPQTCRRDCSRGRRGGRWRRDGRGR